LFGWVGGRVKRGEGGRLACGPTTERGKEKKPGWPQRSLERLANEIYKISEEEKVKKGKEKGGEIKRGRKTGWSRGKITEGEHTGGKKMRQRGSAG